MASIFDADENLVGLIEVAGDRVIARDIDGRELGRFSTSIEAVSALHRAWREPLPLNEHDEQMLFERIAAKLKAGAGD